jgi:hypothetical protein
MIFLFVRSVSVTPQSKYQPLPFASTQTPRVLPFAAWSAKAAFI